MWVRGKFQTFSCFVHFSHLEWRNVLLFSADPLRTLATETLRTLSALHEGSQPQWSLGACSHLLRPFSPQPGLGRVLAVLPALNAGGRSVPWYNPFCRLLRVLYFSTRLRHHEQDVSESERVWRFALAASHKQQIHRSHMYELDYHSLQVVFQFCLVLWFKMFWTCKSVLQRGKSSDWSRTHETKVILQPVKLQTHLLLFTAPAARVKPVSCRAHSVWVNQSCFIILCIIPYLSSLE